MPETPAAARSQLALRRRATAVLLAAVLLGNAGVIIWLWVHGGNLHPHSTGDLLTGIGRLTGLLGAYLALIQVVLLARLPRARAPRRLRPPDGVAPLERSRLHRSHPRPRGLHGLGLRARRRVPAEQGDLDDAGRRHLSGNGDRHGRDGAVHRRRGHLARGGTPQSPVRVVVRGASAGLRGDRAFLVPRDTDRQRARPEPRRRRLLARAVHRNDRRAGALEAADPARSRASLPPARGRGHGGRTRSRVAAHHGAQPRAHGRQLRAVLPLALPRPAFLGHGTSVLALGGTGRAARFASR